VLILHKSSYITWAYKDYVEDNMKEFIEEN